MRTRKCLPLLAAAALLTLGLPARAHADPPPAPWTARDILTPQEPGVVDVDPRGLWFVRANNGDIGFSQPGVDSFFFVSQPLAGDGSVLTLLLGSDASKAGVMLRENATPGARNVLLAMSDDGPLLSFRPTARKSSVSEGGDGRYGSRQLPTWLRLQREGDRFTPFASTDGLGWAQLHSPIPLPGFPQEALAGLAVSTFFAGARTALFDNPTVAPGQLSPMVQVCAGNGTILLTWPPVPRAVGYLIRRSAPAAPAFGADLLTPAPMKETSFSETGRPNGQAVRYLVSAVFEQEGRKVEGLATAIMATPVATPANLFGCDINLETTPLRGAIAFDAATGVYTISGSGSDVGDTEDHGFLAAQVVKGDFQITARILAKPSPVHAASRAGVMVRESLEGAARMLFLAGTAGQGVTYQSRDKTGGMAAGPGATVIADQEFQPPLSLRLVRKGATITAFFSKDGTTFTAAGEPRTFDPPLAESLYVGYAITAHNAGAVARNTFRDLTIGPAP